MYGSSVQLTIGYLPGKIFWVELLVCVEDIVPEVTQVTVFCIERGRERGREGGREGEREKGREGGREGEREGGREGERDGGGERESEGGSEGGSDSKGRRGKVRMHSLQVSNS